ncbi:MAG: hypothetical protein IKG27_04580 [Bacilli bacterium]|nr:hypothetical protein [Bacilli bacterium]
MVIQKKSFIFIFILFLIFLPSKYVLAQEKQITNKGAYCYLCKYKKSDGLMYIKEKQFYNKVEALKSVYGDSVDKVALAAAVLHRYGIDTAYNNVYEKDYNETSYKVRARGLSKLLDAISEDSTGLSEEEAQAVKENEKIDLLTLAALVMVDSNHHGQYSDVCFKDGLAGNRLVGNDSDGILGSVLNAVTCKMQEKGSGSYEGDSSKVADASNKLRLNNLKKVCNNGFVGGLYNGVSNIVDETQKSATKRMYAQQIIDLANYYKKLYSKEDTSCNVNIAGATGDFASWKQADPKWANINMGRTPNVAKYGCMVTSIAMQIARSGTQIGELPSGYTEFNPGAFVTSLSSHGGFETTSANFMGTGYQTIAPNWHMIDMVEVSYADDSNLANLISKELSEPYDGKYQKFIILRIKAAGHSQHWVAVNGVENGHVTVFDPGSSGVGNTLSEGYTDLVINGYKVMYATDVMFGQTGTATNNTCTGGSGVGAIQIPAPYGNGGYTITEIDAWNWLYDCREVYDEWLAKGAKHDNGIATIDGRYLIACTSTFGKVGDKIDFFLEDGTRIPAIMFDTKNPHDAHYNEWGHSDGGNVIEFEVLSSYYHRYGNPGSSEWFSQWGGKRVSSATNLTEGGVSTDYSTNASGTKGLVCVNGQAVSTDGAYNTFLNGDDVFFKQCDGDWKDLPYWFNDSRTAYSSSGTICNSGCGLVASTVAVDILTNQSYTPKDFYNMRNRLGNVKYDMVAADMNPKFNKYNIELFGVRSEKLEQDISKMKGVLQKGGVIVASFGNEGNVRAWHLADGSIPSYQHDKYHYVCIWAYRDGKFLLKDSSAEKRLGNNVGYTDSEMKRLISSNIDGSMWAVYSVNGPSTINYSSSISIPDSLWKSHASKSDPSIVVADSKGKILASRLPDLRREGGSTTKVFAGYAALKLLKPTDTIIGTKYVQDNSDLKHGDDLKDGRKISVLLAATRNFPGSYNLTADNIPLAIGRKYYSSSSDKDAYSKGLQKMNVLFRQIGCTNTLLGNGSGLNGRFMATGYSGFDKRGATKNSSGTGFSAHDLVIVTNEAMKDINFAGHFKDRNKEGLFFIKSGTQSCAHGVWGFNKKGKRYYIAVLGVACEQTYGRKKSESIRSGARDAIGKDVYNWAIKNLIK